MKVILSRASIVLVAMLRVRMRTYRHDVFIFCHSRHLCQARQDFPEFEIIQIQSL